MDLSLASLSNPPPGPKTIIEIVTTGGPCGGKSTFLKQAPAALATPTRRILIVPETPTHLVTGGIGDMALLRTTPAQNLAFQRIVLSFQRQQRLHFRHLAALVPEPEVVILHDRAELDGAAYIDPVSFALLLAEANLTRDAILASYAAVLHLVTASAGAEQFYTLANNPARSESPPAAILQDQATVAAWTPHPHHFIIDNQAPPPGQNGFAFKLERANAALLGFLNQV